MSTAAPSLPFSRTDERPRKLSVSLVAADKVTVLGLAAVLRNETRLSLSGTTTTDLTHVVDTVARQRPDVVVLDLTLGHAQDVAACATTIRHALPATQFVLVAAAHTTHAANAADIGALGLVSRAGDPRELVRAVLLAGRGQAYVSSAFSQATAGPGLSARQERVLGLLADGLDTRAIAEQLHVSPETVKSHVKAILSKLDARGRTHAVAIAIRRSLIA